MEILIAGAAAALAAAVAWRMRGRQRVLQPAQKGLVETPSTRRPRGEGHKGEDRADGQTTLRHEPPPGGNVGASDTAEELVRLRERLEHELAERRAEVGRLEERILQREESLERRLGEVDSRERSLNERELNLERHSEELERASEADSRRSSAVQETANRGVTA